MRFPSSTAAILIIGAIIGCGKNPSENAAADPKKGSGANPKVEGVAAADDFKGTASGESLKGETKDVVDAKVTSILRANPLPCMFWADAKGTAFYTLDERGVIRKISFPDLKETQKIELGQKCSWLSASSEGFVVTLPQTQEVWLLEPAKFTPTQKIAVPNVIRAVSARPIAQGVATNNKELWVLDLKKGTSTRYAPDRGANFHALQIPIMTPDGKYLFTANNAGNTNREVARFLVKDGNLRLEEESPSIGGGASGIVNIQVSNDSKYVTYPIANRNVYQVENIQKPEVQVAGREPLNVLAVDPVTERVYGAGLEVYNKKDGALIKQYQLARDLDMQQLLVHPEGGKLLLLSKDKFLLVELPKSK
jgi:hypothetical protein